VPPHPAQVHDPFVGQMLDGRYQILQRIGEGGMGVVYKCRQMPLDRMVAIKMLNQQMAKDPNWVKRFNQEAKACSLLQHPNTIRMFDFGQTQDGRLFMAMEFLDGVSLRQAIQTTAPMPPGRVLRILAQCCASLAEAHGYGIIHRDIKPDNVFLLTMAGTPDFVKLLDFSVAKLLQENDAMRTQAGVVFGTPQYMSPEQGRGLPLDPRSDIYALGILGYEMLTGRVPFTDDNPMNVLQMHLRQPVPPLPPNVPPAVQNLILRCLDKEPGRRFQSATELMQACEQVMGGGGPAPQQHMGPPPPQMGPPPMAPPPMGAPAAGAAQKTMIADVGGGPPPAGGFGPPPAALKTMIADGPALMAQVRANMPPPGPPSIPPGAVSLPAGPPPGMGGGAPQKTMILDNSEGIVSFAAGGGPAAAVPQPMMDPESTSVTDAGGAGVLFWIFCLLAGLGLGVLAYVILLQLS
jgi:serine/threonine-protein kinase